MNYIELVSKSEHLDYACGTTPVVAQALDEVGMYYELYKTGFQE